MRAPSRRPALRWAVPVALTAVVLTVGVAGPAIVAEADPALPPRTAAQLLVDLQTSSVTGLSGTVVQRAALGLPELPVAAAGSEFTSLISGTHTLRVWLGGDDRQRVALLGTLGESDLVRNGDDVWTWSSATNEATHLQLPAEPRAETSVPTDLPTTPQEAADAALAAIDPSTLVRTDGTATVAGRDAYELVLEPRDDASLVGQIRIAVDAEEHVPLRVRVLAAGAVQPALEIGFTDISFATPADEVFDFRPPRDAVVTEVSPGSGPTPDGVTAAPTVVGRGWTSVLVTQLPAPDPAADPAAGSGDVDALLGSLPQVRGAWGSGRLLSSALLSVLITDDGRVLVGAVAPERLYDAAAG